MSSELECPRCRQPISPHDTVEFDGYCLGHVDCGSPLALSAEERVFLYVYCWDHGIADCTVCARSFRQQELILEPFTVGTYFCVQCRRDLTESVRAHLLSCSTVPEQLRRRVREAREIHQELLKRGRLLLDRAEVLMRELEAARAELDRLRQRGRPDPEHPNTG